MLQLKKKLILTSVFSIGMLILGANAYAEGGGGQGKPPGEEGNKAEAKDMMECMTKFEKGFQGFGENMGNTKIHWAFRVFKEKLRMVSVIIPAEAGQTMCMLNKQLAKTWDGTTIPYEVSNTFTKGVGGKSMTVVMAIVDAKTAGAGWADYERLYTVTVDSKKILQIGALGDASTDKTAGLMIMQNMHEAFNGDDAKGFKQKDESTFAWSRLKDTTEEDADETGAKREGFSFIKILRRVTMEKGGADNFSGQGSNGFGSYAIDAEYRENDKGDFNLTSVDVQGTNSFKVIADGNLNGKGKLAVTHSNSNSGGSKDDAVKTLDSNTQLFKVDFSTSTVESEVNINLVKDAKRFQFKTDPNTLNKAMRGESNDKNSSFKASGATADFTRNPKDSFKRN